MSKFVSNVLSVVVGAVLIAVLPYLWGAISGTSVYVSYNWVSVPPPDLTSSNKSSSEKNIKTLPFLSEEDYARFDKYFKNRDNMVVMQLDIVNKSEERTKELEINISNLALAYTATSEEYRPVYNQSQVDKDGNIKVGPLNPGGKIRFFAITSDYSFQSPTFLVISDGKRIPAYADRIFDGHFGIANFANRNKAISYIAVWAIAMVTVLFLFNIPFSFRKSTDMTYAAKATNADEFIKWQKIINIAKSTDPVKAAALDMSAAKNEDPSR